MTSGELITWWALFSVLIAFPAWEFIQLYRRRKGNKSALTMSQYVTRRAKEGNEFWKWVAILFPFFLFIVAIWLVFHWWALCFSFGWFCNIDV